jgi:uncharacterized lipoprotein YbaY
MPRQRRLRALILITGLSSLVCLSLLASGCSSGGGDQPTGLAFVTGTLNAADEIPLPPEAVATIRLYDMSAEPARIIGEQILGPAGQFPIPFSLTYDRSVIAPSREYAVRVSIRAGRYVIWADDAPVPVLTRGHPDEIEVLVVPTR